MEQIKRTQNVFKSGGLVALAVFFTLTANYLYYRAMPEAVAENIVKAEIKTDVSFKINEAPIIVYHNISPNESSQNKYNVYPEIFERHLAYLKDNGYQTISFEDFKKGYSSSQKQIIIAFDDGWESQYIHALPLLQKYGFTGTFFIVSGYLDKKEFMNGEQIKKLDDAGMEIGAHSKSHAALTKLGQRELEDELAQGKKDLEEIINKEISIFAYPYGLNNIPVRTAIEQAGYKMARTVDAGIAQANSEKFTLRANLIYNDTDMEKILD